MAEDQGTGKHPHKDTEEPYPHHARSEAKGERHSEHERRGSEAEEGSSAKRSDERREGRSDEREKERDLREREYRDSEGNVHHHTHTAQEMKDKKGGERKENEEEAA